MTTSWEDERLPARLPVRPLEGRFALSDAALSAAESLLPTFRGPDGDHEGLIYFLGVERPRDTLLVAAAAPDADHGPRWVRASQAAILAMTQEAHRNGLAVLSQLHSHPGGWTEHSVGDDDKVLMPFEGMLSFVAPHYGRFGLRPIDGLGVHQWQDGRWVACGRESIRDGIRVIPSKLDLR
ncbi:MAG TPA: hypothetical protein VKR30_10450 [Candidatus Limnocylindrales bacterium]|nr:hypothetical protein [Candidatus Limnocylindrales bacterium]